MVIELSTKPRFFGIPRYEEDDKDDDNDDNDWSCCDISVVV